MKVFRVTGEIKKPNLRTPFTKEIVADKAEHATEKVYAELGSKHRVKRHHITISEIVEVSADQIENPILRKLVSEEQKIGE